MKKLKLSINKWPFIDLLWNWEAVNNEIEINSIGVFDTEAEAREHAHLHLGLLGVEWEEE